MNTEKCSLMSKLSLLTLVILSVLILSIVGLAGCGGDKEEDIIASDQILPKEGKYEISGMQAKIPKHPENFGDTLVIERKGETYYVTIEILDNKAVTELYWKDRKDSQLTDSARITNGASTKYVFAFTNQQVQQKLTFQIHVPKMPAFLKLDPPLDFSIDFSEAKLVSETIDDIERPAIFLE